MTTEGDVRAFRDRHLHWLQQSSIASHVAYVIRLQTEDDDDSFKPEIYGSWYPGSQIHQDLWKLFTAAAAVDGRINDAEVRVYGALTVDSDLCAAATAERANEWGDPNRLRKPGSLPVPRAMPQLRGYDGRYGTAYRIGAQDAFIDFADLVLRADGPMSPIEQDALDGFRHSFGPHQFDDLFSDINPSTVDDINQEAAQLALSVDNVAQARAYDVADLVDNCGYDDALLGLQADLANVFLEVAFGDNAITAREAELFAMVMAESGPPFAGTNRDELRGYAVKLKREKMLGTFAKPSSLALLQANDLRRGTYSSDRLKAVMIRLAALAAKPTCDEPLAVQERALQAMVAGICAEMRSTTTGSDCS